MATEKEVLAYIDAHAPVGYQQIARHVTTVTTKRRGGISNILARLQKKGRIEKVLLPDGPKYILSSVPEEE